MPIARPSLQSCSISIDKNLNGGDGISKTMMWKKCAPVGNFAHAETFPVRHAGADRKVRLFSFTITTTGGI